MEPKLSILIPTHNRCELLKQTIASVFSQSAHLDEIEVLISNDASSDDTAMYLDQLAKQKKIKVFHHQKNLGGPGNWHFLLENAKGQFVYLLSDDDCIKPDFLKTYFSVLEQNPQTQIIYSAIEYCDGNMNPLQNHSLSSTPGRLSGRERLKNQLFANHMVMSAIYQRNTFLKVGGWQAKYGTCLDAAAFAKMCTQSEWTYFIKEALFCFRLGDQSWSSFRVEKQRAQYENFRRILDDILIWAQQQDVQGVREYQRCYKAHAQGVLNMLDLKMVHQQLSKKDLRRLLKDLRQVFPESLFLTSYYKIWLVGYLGVSWLQFVRKLLGKKTIYGTSVFEKDFVKQGEKQWV